MNLPEQLDRLRSAALAADIVLIWVYGAIGGSFIERAMLPGRLPVWRLASLGISLMSMGWTLLPLMDFGLVGAGGLLVLRFLGIAFGVFLLSRLIAGRRREAPGQESP